MSAIVKRLVPVFLVEIFLMPISWALFDASSTSVLSYIPMLISFSVLPFVAGYMVARVAHKLRHCAMAGASVSLASIVSFSLWSIFWPQTEDFLLSFAGFILSTILLAVVPQLLFGSLGGWVRRRGHHAISGT